MDLMRSKIVKICKEKQPKNASKFCLKIKQNAIIWPTIPQESMKSNNLSRVALICRVML